MVNLKDLTTANAVPLRKLPLSYNLRLCQLPLKWRKLPLSHNLRLCQLPLKGEPFFVERQSKNIAQPKLSLLREGGSRRLTEG